jgi:signal transduction histidine kinase
LYRKTVISLAIVYSALLLVVLTAFSIGIYSWVGDYFGHSYTSQVEQKLGAKDNPVIADQQHRIVEAAAEIAVTQLRDVLLISDGIAVILVPIVSYAIARRSLRPLIEANESQKRFITNVSHELRTPLAVMSGEFELALKKERDSLYYKRALVSIKEELDRLTRLTQQLLELQRIESRSSKNPLEKKATSPHEVVKKVLQRNSPTIQENGFSIIERSGGEDGRVFFNEALVFTALDNLVSNAIKYSKAGSAITIGYESHGKGMRLYVENTPQQALSKKDKSQIFERFFQPKEEQEKKGFGLGLAIVRAIMEAHGGSVNISTESENIRFTLNIKG